jgi:hypothetical protein
VSVYKDNRYDVTVECDNCHDLYFCDVQLFSQREIKLIKEVLDKMFTRCHNCGADRKQFAMTVSNEYFTAEEIKQRRENKIK